MSIEQAAREYIRLRRLRLSLKRERFRLMYLCAETDDDEKHWSGFSACLASGYWDDRDDRPIDSWDEVPLDNDGQCVWCRIALRAERAYMRTAYASGAALRRLERMVNRDQ